MLGGVNINLVVETGSTVAVLTMVSSCQGGLIAGLVYVTTIIAKSGDPSNWENASVSLNASSAHEMYCAMYNRSFSANDAFLVLLVVVKRSKFS